VAGTLAVFLIRNVWLAEWRDKPLRVHYPGQLVTTKMTSAYRAHYGIEPAIIAGEAWIANNIVCYSQLVPVVYPTAGLGYLVLNEKLAPWTSDSDLRGRGGILVWELDRDGGALPPSLRDRFPLAVAQPPLIVPYQGRSRFASARIGWALVSPLGR
jgi:hypothetical protein